MTKKVIKISWTPRCSVKTSIIKRQLKYLSKLSKNSMPLKMAKKNFNFSCLQQNFWDPENWLRCSIHQNPKTESALTPETDTLVKKFYECDDLNRMIPGIKDFASVKNDDGTHSHIQKRLLLCNLNELCAQFTSKHEGLKISISKSTKLRPRHCVLRGSSGTLMCAFACTMRMSVLLLNKINIQNLTKDTDIMFKNDH